MKIRPSIRLYFLVATLITGVGSISVMTVTAVNYFFSGMDVAMTGFLRSQAVELPLGQGNSPIQVDDLTVAAHWEDLPQVIQDNFDKADLTPNKLLKKIDGIPVLAPPKFGYFVMKAQTDTKVRYTALVLTHLNKDDVLDEEIPPFFYIIFTGVGAIVVFSGVLILIQKKVSTPVEKLRSWAKKLDKEQLTKPVPNFHYSELNSLANLIQQSLSTVQESLEREQRFLGYASHELRTPIAVTRTNAELLRKMIVKDIPVDKQLAVLDRIERAGYTMTDLTETLLWLNRQEGKSLPSKPIMIGKLIKQVETELHHLLQGKSVKVTVCTDYTELDVPEGLCRIIITNLVRNAFQHTQNGEVIVNQVGDKVSIVNQNLDNQTKPDDLGFGLGLELTERLVNQYGWGYETSNKEDGWEVEIQFC